MSTSRDVRVALVGAGYVSAYHIRALQTLPHVSVVGIADASVDRARTVARQFGIPGVFATLSELRTVNPDVVHILTPPASHCNLTVEALEMGCDVFVEKPMAPTVAECDEMIAVANRTGRRLSVNHSAKVDPVIVRALELLRRGAIGDVLAVDVYRSSDYAPYAGGPLPPHSRYGGYPFLDMGIHALYVMEAFLGRIRGLEASYRSTGHNRDVFFDEWRGTVTGEKGDGALYLSWSARPIRNELFVHGTRGDMHIDCFLQTCTVRKSLPGPKPIVASINAMTQAAGTLWNVPRNAWRLVNGSLRPSPGIHAGVLQFHEALAQSTAPPVSMDEGRRMIAWLAPVCEKADHARDQALRVKESLEPRKILVTGASGLLGRTLVDRLRENGESIRVLVRRRSTALEGLPGVEVVYGDLGDPDAVDRAIAGTQLVYHVGATMRGRHWAEFEAGTVNGTTNVVDACVKHNVGRLIHVSSITVLDYATQSSQATVDETSALESCLEQRGAYTRAKVLAERTVVDASRRRGLQTVVVRPGQIVGPGYESVSPYGAIALAGRWIVVGSGRLTLPLVHVNDVVEGLIAAATQPDVCGSVFHLVDSTPLTQRDYIDWCREQRTANLQVHYIPRLALLAAATAFDFVGRLLGRSLPLSRYRIQSIKELTFDCRAAKARLRWKPTTGVAGELSTTSDTTRGRYERTHRSATA